MSRTRLITSLIAMVCCLALAITLAARTFPLKAAPKGGVGQGVSSGTSGGVAGGTSGGVNGGVQGGVGGGVSGGVSGGLAGDIPTVGRDTIWTDTVKRGAMVRQVRGLGKLVRSKDSGSNFLVRVTLPEAMLKEVQLNQSVTVETRRDPADARKGLLVKGHISGLNREVSNGTGTVEVALEATLPQGAEDGLDVDATIDIEKMQNILYVGRPAQAAANSTVSLFKIVSDGAEAVHVKVKMGRSSVNTIEVLDGLKEGDKVILSDMSQWDSFDRIHLK